MFTGFAPGVHFEQLDRTSDRPLSASPGSDDRPRVIKTGGNGDGCSARHVCSPTRLVNHQANTVKPLLGPVRVRFGVDPAAAVAGAWYPYTLQLADELPGMLTTVRAMVGDVSGIDVNWSSFRRLPGLDSPDSPETPPLMTLTTPARSVTLLVIPPRTVSSLAAILLRQASGTVVADGRCHSLEFRRAERILVRAGLAATSCRIDAQTSSATHEVASRIVPGPAV